MKWHTIAILVLIGLFALFTIGEISRYIRNLSDTAFEEFSPEALLEKYEWFKYASAQLDKKLADIKVYSGRVENMDKAYEGVPRNQWARTDLDDYNLWTSEVSGIKASYNSLAGDYNAQMAKFNYRFANVGELPKGATEPLPREYKPYVEK